MSLEALQDRSSEHSHGRAWGGHRTVTAVRGGDMGATRATPRKNVSSNKKLYLILIQRVK